MVHWYSTIIVQTYTTLFQFVPRIPFIILLINQDSNPEILVIINAYG